ncbi:MAG: homogentisate 1,2-dioxygenase [Alphaproteobacteria bacterium]|nr:homogentisate 1,2-dioxygenase [Alphaproteobacteria bacterium]
MMTTMTGAQAQQLVERARTLPANQWHEVTRINGATVYLVRAEPRDRPDFDLHDDADEYVVPQAGTFTVETPDGIVSAKPGESLLVPRGTRHRGKLAGEAIILLIR